MIEKPRVVLITGASSGIGHATAERFAAAGWSVAATMRDPARAPVFAATPGRIDTFALDVTRPETITAAITAVERELGPVDVLVNNAGYGTVGPFESFEPAEIERQFATNVFGLMDVTRAVLPGMRARKKGLIVNVASVGGRITFPYYSAYHATKWAVEGFSESLRYELRPFGIGVKIIEPGPIRTEFYGRSETRPDAARLGAYEHHFKRIYARMQRAGRKAPGPEIVAAAILKAATDGTTRIRYTPNATMLLALRRVFGGWLFTRGIKSALRAWED